jgi:spore coat polysaccharide biosynthesis protein SpsF
MSMPLVTLIQARMSSSRLPGKVLLPLGDGLVLDQVVRRCAAFSAQVVVCTSTDPSDDPIRDHCGKIGTPCVRGDLHDVFARFRTALLDAGVQATEWFARVTADCPLISVPLAQQLMATVGAEPGLDYACVQLERAPRGLPIELVRRRTFLGVEPASLDAPQREHVTPVFYENPHRYRCLRSDVPPELRHPELRLTLDHSQDYQVLQRLFEDPGVSAESAVARMLADPELPWINAHCEQRSVR